MTSKLFIADLADEQNNSLTVFLCITGCILSPTFLLVHLYKFFSASADQSLPSRNLASYCVCSLLMYASMMFSTCFTGVKDQNKLLSIKEYLYFTSSSLLFNMSLDTYLCLKKSVHRFYISKGPRNYVFAIYTIFAWGVSLLATVVLYFVIESAKMRFNVVLAVTMLMRMFCFGLFCVSAYYIVSANITNKDLKSYVFMHTRLLLINGITSILWYATAAIIYCFDVWNWYLQFLVFLSVTLYAFDGVFIALFYTFKKDMFKNKSATESEENCISMKTSDFSSSTYKVTPFGQSTVRVTLEPEPQCSSE